MSTPIETNTEQLQEVLQQVYNLPNRSGGSSELDLVIGLNVSNTKVWQDGTTDTNRNLQRMTLDDVSILSGSVSATAEKVRQGLPVKVLLNDIHFYWSNEWYRSVAEASHVLVYNYAEYPNENETNLDVAFYLSNMGSSVIAPVYFTFSFSIASGKPTWINFSRLATE